MDRDIVRDLCTEYDLIHCADPLKPAPSMENQATGAFMGADRTPIDTRTRTLPF